MIKNKSAMDKFQERMNDFQPEVLWVDDLQCGNCKYKIEKNFAECEIYATKPGYVMTKSKECPDFEKR